MIAVRSSRVRRDPAAGRPVRLRGGRGRVARVARRSSARASSASRWAATSRSTWRSPTRSWSIASCSSVRGSTAGSTSRAFATRGHEEEQAFERGDLDEVAWMNVRTWLDGPTRGESGRAEGAATPRLRDAASRARPREPGRRGRLAHAEPPRATRRRRRADPRPRRARSTSAISAGSPGSSRSEIPGRRSSRSYRGSRTCRRSSAPRRSPARVLGLPRRAVGAEARVAPEDTAGDDRTTCSVARMSELVRDMQASAPPVGLALSRAGVTGVHKAIRIRRGDHEILMAADIDCTVDLARDQKGVHMSRFPELFDEAIDEVVLGEGLLVEVARRPDRVADRRAPARPPGRGADRGALAPAPPHARDRPGDPGDGLADRHRRGDGAAARAAWSGSRRPGSTPARARRTSSAAGRPSGSPRPDSETTWNGSSSSFRIATHNQRGRGTLLVGTTRELDAEDLARIVERSMSAPVYELLKRPGRAARRRARAPASPLRRGLRAHRAQGAARRRIPRSTTTTSSSPAR